MNKEPSFFKEVCIVAIPVALQSMLQSSFSMVDQIMTGKQLGKGSYELAYRQSKKLILYGLSGCVLLSVLLIPGNPFYVNIYHVEASVKVTAGQLLLVFALISPVKVLNMILGGGSSAAAEIQDCSCTSTSSAHGFSGFRWDCWVLLC